MPEHSPRKNEQQVATKDEVIAAIKSLGDSDWVKLKKFDEVLLDRIRGSVWGVSDGDLLQEAVISVLEVGRRYWDPHRVDIEKFLMGAMRSIASNWKRKGSKTPPPLLESDRTSVNEGGEEIPTALAAARDQRPDPEQSLLVREMLLEIEEFFRGDDVASLVIEGWKNRMKGPEIRDSLGLTQNEFDAAVRRIRRWRDARRPKGSPYVQ